MDRSPTRGHPRPQPAYLKPTSFSSLLQDIPEDLLFESKAAYHSTSAASSTAGSVDNGRSPASSIRSAGAASRPRKSVRFGEVDSARTSVASFESNPALDSKPAESQPTQSSHDRRPRGWRQSLSKGFSSSLKADKKPGAKTASNSDGVESDFEAWLSRMPKIDGAANAATARNQAQRPSSMMGEAPREPNFEGRLGRRGRRRQSWTSLFPS